MPKPIEEHVTKVMAKNGRSEKFLEAQRHAWHHRNDHPRSAKWRRKTTRASVVWEDTIDKLIELLDGDPGFHLIAHHDTFSFIFDDAVLVRCKKGDVTLKSRNVQTLLADLFDDHDVDLFGYNGLQRIEAMYVLNQIETDFVWNGIVARDSGKHLWHLSFEDIADITVKSEEPGVVMFPTPESKGTTADLAKLRKAEAEIDDEKKNKGE